MLPLWSRPACHVYLLIGLLLAGFGAGAVTSPALPPAPAAAIAHDPNFAADVASPIASEPTIIESRPPVKRVTDSAGPLLRIAGPVDDYPSLDPAQTRDQTTAFLIRHLFRGLVALDTNLEPVPELAERIEISADRLTYTFLLRQGVVFHDGRPISADDVVRSFARALDPATVGGDPALVTAAAALGDIDGATALVSGRATKLVGAAARDERTVVLRLVAPRATFLAKLASPTAAIVDPTDPERGAEWWRSPNGSGPFRLASWRPGEAIVLERFADYAPGPSSLSGIEIRLGAAAAQPFNLYQAGEIDIVAVPPWAVDRVRAGDERLAGTLQEVPVFSTALLGFRPDVPPTDDPHVRRALQLAFPRHLLIDVGFVGTVVLAEGVIPTGMLGRSWPVEVPPVDIEVARRELAASRYGAAASVPPIRVYGAGSGAAETLRDVLAANLGLRIEVVDVEWDDFNTGLAGGDFPAVELVWGADYPDPESFLWSLFASDSPDNYLGFADPRFDALVRQAAASDDPGERAMLYDQAHQHVIDSGIVVPLYHDVERLLLAPSVKGVVVTPLGILSLDQAWLEEG